MGITNLILPQSDDTTKVIITDHKVRLALKKCVESIVVKNLSSSVAEGQEHAQSHLCRGGHGGAEEKDTDLETT